jgi:hypothetical protein
MPWLKRNLVLVVAGVVALGLLGFAGYFLFNKVNDERQVTEQLDQATEQLKTLVNRDPHPGTPKVNNIAAAKEENKKLQAFVDDLRKYFVPPALPAHLNSRDFRLLLDTTITALQAETVKSGVKTPDTNYWFTFSGISRTMTFADNALEPLSSQLVDVKNIIGVLCDAKVNSLVSLKRAPTTSIDNTTTAAQDYHGLKASTNEWTVSMPYEVTFYGFSSEIASVLEGFIHSPECFVVKNVVVGHASTDQQSQEAPVYPMGGMRPGYPGSGGMDPALMSRYGLGSRYGGGRPMPQMQQPVAPRPVARPTSNNVLEEKMLQVTLTVDAVKLKPSQTAAKKT